MQRPKAPPSQETITIAENILSETFGGKIRLNEGEDLQGGIRMNVYRFIIIQHFADCRFLTLERKSHWTQQKPVQHKPTQS